LTNNSNVTKETGSMI